MRIRNPLPAPPSARARLLGLTQGVKRLFAAFFRPILPGEREAAARRWKEMPPSAHLRDQVLGRATAGCGATHGVLEGCNLSCSACYLDTAANSTPPLPFHEVCEQLDTIREHLGPWGNVQITAGEVTLLPVEELVRILGYCRGIQLSPMVMTNGEVFLQDPGYLETLVGEGGLDNLAIHIDTTMRGRRHGQHAVRERELHPLRDRFAVLLGRTRARTRRPLHAAQNVTVTPDTLQDVPDVIRWALRNAGSFRMLSFQPVAGVGRTRVASAAALREELWQGVREGLGRRANEHAWFMGDPECNSMVLLWVVSVDGQPEVVEIVREGSRLDAWFFRRLVQGGLGGWRQGGEPTAIAAARLCGRLARHPRYLLEVPFFSLYRAWTDRRQLGRLLGALLRGRPFDVKPFALVVHHFMDADELDTERGRERLAACAFRVPLDGRMVSMCEVNGTELRRELNLQVRGRAREGPRPPGSTAIL